ncbi:MAG: hypothetical protein J1F09_06690 [Oscillospiraceae bacterium]|nr:hypothetical protein [Oscillospiraceae bacterium]
MRRKLSRRMIVWSLMFPIGTTVWAVFNIISEFMVLVFGVHGIFPHDFGYILAVLVGGVLSTVLTLAVGIDTSEYFMPRLLIFVSAIGIVGIAGNFVGEQMVGGPTVIMYIASIVFSSLFFYKVIKTRISEWIIIFISNPILYYLIYYSMYYFEIEEKFGRFPEYVIPLFPK